MYHHPAHGWSEVIHNLAIRKASIEETWGWGITWDGGRAHVSRGSSMRIPIFEAPECGFKISGKSVSVIMMTTPEAIRQYLTLDKNGWLLMIEGKLMKHFSRDLKEDLSVY